MTLPLFLVLGTPALPPTYGFNFIFIMLTIYMFCF